jgi:hypothetical protein
MPSEMSEALICSLIGALTFIVFELATGVPLWSALLVAAVGGGTAYVLISALVRRRK